ncbi:ClpP/crotonase-like domain-containing protein [Paraphysoderma sedebokerense]|nr:ClpP/crotonase-like domain-containing protein [Paraphysoderma sedebokerense]
MTLGGSLITGIGLIHGIECMVTASVPTLFGGANNEVTVLKSLRAQEIAMQNNLPTVNLVQTAGANLSQQSKVFHAGGATFRNLARISKKGVPNMSVVFGSSTAGGAYLPGMSDYTIFVRNQARVFLGGPPLVFAATGEKTTDEALGGADMHSKVSGVNDLLGIVSANIRVPFDAREVIARLVDGSRFSDFKPLYGPNLITGWATIHGHPVGILANNNVIFVKEANKATQFINLCNMRNTPLLFLNNITGFMVGKKYEEDGIIKAGARFINAVANSGVPAISLMMGASYGAGNYAMCGRAYNPRFLFSWPNSKCSVMGPEQLTNVMEIIAREAAQKSGRKINEEQLSMRKAMLGSLVEEESSCYFTSSRLLDDGIIDPRETRDVLAICLSVVYGEKVDGKTMLGGVSRM